MNVFVTGGAGYVGSVAVDQLIRSGHQVTVFDSLERGHRQAVHSAATWMVGDLRNPDQIRQAVQKIRPDAIVHFAAYAYVEESVRHPLRYFENNVLGSFHLIRAAVEAEVRKFVFSSSCAVYGVPDRLPVTEETPLMPVSPYGESKRMTEQMLIAAQAEAAMETVILRYFNACGAAGAFGEDHSPETHIIPLALQAAAEVRVFTVFGDTYQTPDGTCIRDYVHVSDLARAHVDALRPGLSAVINLGSGRGCSVREVLQAVERVTGRAIEVRTAPARPGDPPVLIADNRRAKEILGWTPQHASIDGIVRDAWEWMQRHPGGYVGAQALKARESCPAG